MTTTLPDREAARIHASAGTGIGLTLLFAFTILLSAALLFMVQPLFARMILPQLGGTPSTWNTCLLSFQTILLAGYFYVHAVQRLAPRLQLVIHGALLGATLLALPIGVSTDGPVDGADPRLWLVRALTWSIGLPFFALSTTAPLLQRWFGLSTRRDPYFLYAASNAGSLIGLVAYPFVVEPTLTLADQRTGWSMALAVAAVLIGTCGALSLATMGGLTSAEHLEDATPDQSAREPWRVRLTWLALSFVPSSLLLGVTTHISTDVAAVPLLWVVPLALYLGTFVAAFAVRPILPHLWLIRVMPIVIVATFAAIVLNAHWFAALAILLTSFTVVALVCHRELAERRPHARALTRFYLWVSIGGALGGVFNALVAPVVFSQVIEYPLALLAAAIIRPTPRWRGGQLEPRFLAFGLPAVALLVTAVSAAAGLSADIGAAASIVAVGLLAAAVLAFANRTSAFAAVIAVVTLAHFLLPHQQTTRTVFSARSFFGTHRITSDEARVHRLFHGTTLHGWQPASQRESCEPTSYYHRTGPIGQVFTALGSRVQSAALIGLGAGALACYGRADTSFTFYEIDPVVERIARDPSLFTFLANAQGALKVVIGDGRITLGRAAPETYDLVVVDAFSSDAIPVHLMTREFVAMALARLRTSGLVAFHISNQHFDLGPTLGAAATALGTAAIEQYETGDHPDATASRWLLIGKNPESLAVVGRDARWRPVRAAARGWTDDFSNILDVLRWSAAAAAGAN